jgi:hypothetical protein
VAYRGSLLPELVFKGISLQRLWKNIRLFIFATFHLSFKKSMVFVSYVVLLFIPTGATRQAFISLPARRATKALGDYRRGHHAQAACQGSRGRAIDHVA